MQVGDRVTTNTSKSMCRHLWGQSGTIIEMSNDPVDGQMVRVEFDKPVPSPAESWPAMESCNMQIDCISGHEE